MIDKVEQPPRLQRDLQLVVETGCLLAKSTELTEMAQCATDAGLQLSGAQMGAFIYLPLNPEGDRYRIGALAGEDADRFAHLLVSREDAWFAALLETSGTILCADVAQHPLFCQIAPLPDRPPHAFSVRSCLVAPLATQAGESLGCMVFGHSEKSGFDPDSEEMVGMVAAETSRAMETLRLREQLKRKIEELEKLELRLLEDARRANEVAAIVESSDDAILSKDLTGKIMSWNPAASRILGYSREEIIGKSILMLIPEELHPEEKTILEKIRSGQRIDHFETVRLTKSGERIDVSLSISPVRDASGTIVGASKTLRDIRQKKQMEKSLLQAEKIAAIGRMAATIAHEINNPLEAIMNLVFLARTRAGDKESVTSLMSAAESELVRVSHIARQTLGFYRENASPTSASLNDLATDAVRIYEPRCSTANIRVEKCLNSTRRIMLRKGEMMQVISNLLANSIYAMSAGGTLSISTADVETAEVKGVTLTVEDTGSGIAPENLPRIFEAFFTTRRSIGTGIGLFVAKQFVEGHKGKITVSSSVDPRDHGTRMTVFLPLRDGDAGKQ